jgi:hypothetical protein
MHYRTGVIIFALNLDHQASEVTGKWKKADSSRRNFSGHAIHLLRKFPKQNLVKRSPTRIHVCWNSQLISLPDHIHNCTTIDDT